MIFETICQGSSSGIEEKLEETCRSLATFQALWTKHQSIRFPPQECPNDIDFSSSLIVCVFRGQQNSGGYSIEITEVTETDSEIVVRAETTDPRGMAACVMTQPHHIVKISPTSTSKTIKFTISAKPVEPVFPAFIVALNDKQEISKVAGEIESNTVVKRVDKLAALGMCTVHFHQDQIAAPDAAKLLEAINGVKYVEADAPM